jgi:hypothetical protein
MIQQPWALACGASVFIFVLALATRKKPLSLSCSKRAIIFGLSLSTSHFLLSWIKRRLAAFVRNPSHFDSTSLESTGVRVIQP